MGLLAPHQARTLCLTEVTGGMAVVDQKVPVETVGDTDQRKHATVEDGQQNAIF